MKRIQRSTTVLPKRAAGSLLAAATIMLSACGKPAAGGGQAGGGYSVSAVVAPAVRQPIEERLTLVASLRARDTVDLVAEVDAQVLEVGFTDGANVQSGDMLFRLDPAKFRATVAEAEARVVLARANLERARVLAVNQTISRQELDQAESAFQAAQAALDLAREQLADTEVRAPFAGRMSARAISPGQFVSRGRHLATLVSNGELEMEFHVPERHLAQVALGQSVAISTVAFPNETFTGIITYLAPALDTASRTLPVRASLGNPDGRLRPGMFGRLELAFQARESAIVIPESALSFRGDQVMVVVRNGDGAAEFRPVRPGLRLAGYAEIIDGLTEGEQVVVEGFQKMGPGTPIAISPKSARYGLEADSVPGN